MNMVEDYVHLAKYWTIEVETREFINDNDKVLIVIFFKQYSIQSLKVYVSYLVRLSVSGWVWGGGEGLRKRSSKEGKPI